MKALLHKIGQCDTCKPHLVDGVRPVVRASANSQILVIGQAPGRKVHDTGVPWNDPSGVQLRQWLGVSDEQFYDTNLFALMPMGFCYPGKGKSGDLPPRPECAPQWHHQLLEEMPHIELTLLIGLYAQQHYLPTSYPTLTETVRQHELFLPTQLPLPHPSPRNRIWQKKNPWFVTEVVPKLRDRVAVILSSEREI